MEAFLLLLIVLIYFLPSLIASIRAHTNRLAILIINLFLGWTLIGWVIALAWAFTNQQVQQATEQTKPKETKNYFDTSRFSKDSSSQ